jgi:hypothetical protein
MLREPSRVAAGVAVPEHFIQMNFTPPKDPFAYNSSRHHYIPEHYSKGFCDENGMLYVYDKVKDIFLKNGRSPKAIFFEKDRNTLFNKEGEKISLLEDTIYKMYDQQCAPVINDFRNKPNSEELHSYENLALLTIFIVTLFWRTPKLDSIFKTYFGNGKFRFYDKDNQEVTTPELVEQYRNDEEIMKTHKAGMFIETVNRLLEMKGGQIHSKLYDRGGNVFLTSDFPIIYPFFPNKLVDVDRQELYLSVSSSRVYYTASQSTLKWDDNKIVMFNISIIDQAHRFVCGSNKALLEESVNNYKIAKSQNLTDHFRLKLFTNQL